MGIFYRWHSICDSCGKAGPTSQYNQEDLLRVLRRLNWRVKRVPRAPTMSAVGTKLKATCPECLQQAGLK
jgi:hypothetical protein